MFNFAAKLLQKNDMHKFLYLKNHFFVNFAYLVLRFKPLRDVFYNKNLEYASF